MPRHFDGSIQGESMNQSTSCRSLLAAAIAGVLAFGAVTQVHAQSAQQRRANRSQKAEVTETTKAVEQYPDASRTPPDGKASAKVTPKLKKMMELYDATGQEARDADKSSCHRRQCV
jgi:hypothetical protein